MPHEVLYRKFRPQTFAAVVNQEAVKTTLTNAVAENKVAHAYLFTGPRGVGKTSMARILAKALNCLKPKKGEPCDSCANCEAVREGRFLDLIEIDAASHTGVDNVRELIEHVKFSPAVGRFKVIVVDEVHMLSKGAFNALLKTLEFFPAHAVFVLATTELSKVPATIVSRTQRFDFKRLSQADIAGQLEKVLSREKTKLGKEVVKLIARAADGGMRDAFSLLDQLLAFGEDALTLERAEEILGLSSFSSQQEFLNMLSSSDLSGVYVFVKALVARGGDAMQFASGFLEYLDMVLGMSLTGGNGDNLGLVPEDLEILKQHAKIPQGELAAIAQAYLTAAARIKSSPLPELPLVLAAVEYVERSGQTPPARLGPEAGTKPTEKHTPVEKSVDPAPKKPAMLSETDDFLPEISKNWNKFLSQLKDYNHSLLSSLRLATLIESDGISLLVAFPYRFHKDTVEQRKNKIVVEKVLEEVYGRPLKFKCCMTHEADEYKQKTPKVKGSLMDEALKVFRIDEVN
ncbi:MAG: DNA polymerase III subunit gamma/tau [Patescibacteria group bacterium]|nr:DNA polymerase III subunit gamma/tau [Patescibacteria group bacterium]